MRAVSKGMPGGRRQGTLSAFLRFIVRIAAVITVSVFVFLVGYILVKGVPHITIYLRLNTRLKTYRCSLPL